MLKWHLGFGSEPEQGAVKETAAPAMERPVAELRGISYEQFQKMRDYTSIAKSVGFRPAELILVELYDFLEKQSIKIFSYGAVYRWLNSKRPAGIDHWCWRPLREKDVIKEYLWGFEAGSNGQTISSSGYYNYKRWDCRPYSRLVPQHALEKMEKIALQFGDEVKFFVSDFAVPDLDPFIMARPAACDDAAGPLNNTVVFDMWDEPGFGA